MERLDMNDIELLGMMAIELEKIMDEIKEDLNRNPRIGTDLGVMFENPENMAILLVMVYATMDTEVRRRLDNVAEMYREASA